MKFSKALLYPVSLLYGGVTRLRNFMYEKKVLASEKFPVPVMVVGNLTVGGTGKTPHVEYLIRLLKNKARLAVLSRGYKRKTKGFILAGQSDTAHSIGDEPMLYHTQFNDIQVAVGEDRPAAIKKLLATAQPPEIILLDDAFQHRPLQASFYVLLTDYGRLFYKDQLLPAGLLRESREGAARANAIVVSKSPVNISSVEQEEIKRCVARYSGQQTPIFFTSYKYGNPVAFGNSAKFHQKVILLTGIANPAPLREHLQSKKIVVAEELAFPDHYAYTEKDLRLIEKKITGFEPENVSVITTSKDAIKLQAPEMRALAGNLPLFYLPIEVIFADGKQTDFDNLLRKAARVF